MKKLDQAEPSSDDEWEEAPLPAATQPSLQRDDWMNESYDSIGTQKKRRNPDELPDDQLTPKELTERKKKSARIDRELNPDFKKVLETNQDHEALEKFTGTDSIPLARKYEFGDKGSSWRMIKLKRVFELAERESLAVEEVALERYGSLEEFKDALAERDFLSGKSSKDQSVNRKRSMKFMDPRNSSSSTAQGETVRRSTIPAAITSHRDLAANEDVLSVDQLNKLYSKLLKARMMGSSDVEELEKRYEMEKERSKNSTKV